MIQTDANELKKQEKELFLKWIRSTGIKPKEFCQDGIVSHSQWISIPVKVIFLLKETNKNPGSLIDFLKSNENRRHFGATWLNIARWAYGIKNISKDKDWTTIDSNVDKTPSNYLKYICAINIKKTTGGGSSSHTDLLAAVEEYGELTLEQINLYQANILVLCGTGSYFLEMLKNNNKIKWEKTSRGIAYNKFENGLYIIWYYHPDAHFPKHFLYYSLLDAIKEILGK